MITPTTRPPIGDPSVGTHSGRRCRGPCTALVLMLLLLALASSVTCHLMMTSPAPRRARNNPGPGNLIDYDGTSPLGVFPCKGFPRQQPVLTVAAGSAIPVTVAGGAPHDGGHCQFALSYDDRTWVVVDTIIRECARRSVPFLATVTIPANAPSGTATFAWTWINAVGNREYYMSCADIEITGGSGPQGSLSGPELLVAHLPGFTQFTFPEFGGNQPDGRDQFERRRVITVSAGAPSTELTSSSAVHVAPTSTVVASTTVPATATSTSLVSVPSTQTSGPTATPWPTTPPAAEECRPREYTCVPNEPEVFLQCVFGSWMRRPTAPGTVCAERNSPNGRSIVLVHAPKRSS